MPSDGLNRLAPESTDEEHLWSKAEVPKFGPMPIGSKHRELMFGGEG